MNVHNSNKETLNHLQALMRFPERAAELQKTFNAQRLARVLRARSVRPLFIPLSFLIENAVQATPFMDKTPRFNYPIVLLGAASDFSKNQEALTSIQVSIDREEILCITDDPVSKCHKEGFANSYQQGQGYFPKPILLMDGQRLYVDVFAPAGGGAAGGVKYRRNMVLNGQRIMPANSADVLLDAKERELVNAAIAARSVPVSKVISMRVQFPAAAAGSHVDVTLPTRNEPFLIRAMRSQTLAESTIEIGTARDKMWTTAPTPIWGLANCFVLSAPGSAAGVDGFWQFFETPFYISPNEDLTASFVSSSDNEVVLASFDQDGITGLQTPSWASAPQVNLGLGTDLLALEFLVETI